ncbi:hypothetical protein BC332_03231 [Capsicum chinense]|nr:hypothetical protein BC332_03231 [Capsicum chinense]
MSLIPSFFGDRRSNIFDPFSLDLWDPFKGFPNSSIIANTPSSARETPTFTNARIDWKETPEDQDVPEIKKEEIKATMENRVLTVTVPKEEEKKPEVKAIDISS